MDIMADDMLLQGRRRKFTVVRVRDRSGRVAVGRRPLVPVKTRRVAWTQGEVSDPTRRTLSFSLFFITPWMQGDTLMYEKRRQWRKQGVEPGVLCILCMKWKHVYDVMSFHVFSSVSFYKLLWRFRRNFYWTYTLKFVEWFIYFRTGWE